MYIHPGFLPDLEEAHKEKKDFQFLGGNLPKIVLNDFGNWRGYLPILEIQRNDYFDTYSCTNYSNNNATEMMHKLLYGEEKNDSDRFSAVVSGTIFQKGNSHKNVAEVRRNKGSVLEVDYPFTQDLKKEEYFVKTPPKDLLDKGLQWVADYEYGYETVGRDEFEEALRYSPIQIAVDSRTNKANQVSNYDHSIVLTCKDKLTKKNYTFDSYLNRFVEYDWDYPFSYGLRFNYKRLINIILNDMKMQLIRNKDTGKIYLVDSDSRKHHIEAPNDFFEFIGKTAWAKEDWINLEPVEVDKFEEGLNISAKKTTFAEALLNLFKIFGKKR